MQNNTLLLEIFSWLTTSQICLSFVFMKHEKCIRYRTNQRRLFNKRSSIFANEVLTFWLLFFHGQ